MLKKVSEFIDNNILLILSSILLIVIPLYPKLPLFDIIEGYIVRVRLEDFLILFTWLIFLFQVIKKRATLKTPLTKIILAYTLVGLLSVLSGIFITKTIPLTQVHLLKSTLHYLRYLEYFTLFFIFYSAVKTRKDLKIIIYTFATSYILVGLYGIGQKYLYWPVYSTMNREFSKGIRLYLTEHARVQSTFGGHYDMAAYLVILLPIIFLFTQDLEKKLARSIAWIMFSIGMWLMVTGASRTSFIAGIVGIFITIIIRSLKEKKKKEKISFFIKKSIITGTLTLIIFSSFGDDISERLLQTLNSNEYFYSNYKSFTNNLDSGKEFIASKLKASNLDSKITIEKPKNGLSTDEAAIIVASDTRPTPLKPSDVFVDVPNKIKISSMSATGEWTTVIIEAPRTYSDNALKYGLSLAIRLDTLWPQALKGFYANPLLGTGYATLTKSENEEFTEADSTDNNFLRTLGEIGLLGFIIFYGIIILSIKQAFKTVFKKSPNLNLNTGKLPILISIAFIGSSIGLLINATFIDVFASSKVALTFWSLVGIIFAVNKFKDSDSDLIAHGKRKNSRKKSKKGKFTNASNL